MGVTSYATLDGEIVSENRVGVIRDYLPDPLGSTAALLDSLQVKTDAWTYWPFGEERTQTGTTNTAFRFVGILGYFRDDSGRCYVRARHYRTSLGRWQAVDPLWPTSTPYQYTENNPVTYIDPTGHMTCEKILDACLKRAETKQKLCQLLAHEEYQRERAACKVLGFIGDSPCERAARIKYTAASAACFAKAAPLFALCGASYQACIEGRDASHKIAYFTIGLVVTYGLYRGCKAIVGVIAAPETGGASTIIIWTP